MKVTLDGFSSKLKNGMDVIISVRGQEYFIGTWYNNKLVIFKNPDGASSFYANTNHLLEDHRIDGIPLGELISEIDIVHI